MRDTRVTAASGVHERSPLQDVWTSVEAFQAAAALLGEAPSRRIEGQRVPRGVGTAALALAWNRRTEALQAALDAHGYVVEDAMPVLARAMSMAADSAAAFNLRRQDVERVRKVAMVPPSPVRSAAGDTLGRHVSRDEENEEEPPQNMRRGSSSVDADGRGPARR